MRKLILITFIISLNCFGSELSRNIQFNDLDCMHRSNFIYCTLNIEKSKTKAEMKALNVDINLNDEYLIGKLNK